MRAAVRGANHIERTLALPRRLPPLTCSCGRRLGAARTTFVLRCKPLWAAIAVTTVSGMRSYRATMDAAAGGARVFVPGQGRRLKRRRTASSGGHIVEPSLAPLSAAPDVELSRTPPRRWGRTSSHYGRRHARYGLLLYYSGHRHDLHALSGYCRHHCGLWLCFIARSFGRHALPNYHERTSTDLLQWTQRGAACALEPTQAPPWTACALTMLSWTPRRAGCATELSRGPSSASG